MLVQIYNFKNKLNSVYGNGHELLYKEIYKYLKKLK